MRCTRLMTAFLFSALVVSWGPPANAATCNVPTTTYTTIQSAVDDVSCTEIVLAAQSYLEPAAIARSLTLRGAGSSTTVIEEQVSVTAGTVVLQDLTVGVSSPFESNRYAAALSVSGGAQVSGTDLVVAVHKCPTKTLVDRVKVRSKVSIDTKCDGCAECVKVCPVKGAIEGEEGERHKIVWDKCIGCGLCIPVCPKNAIYAVGALGYDEDSRRSPAKQPNSKSKAR